MIMYELLTIQMSDVVENVIMEWSVHTGYVRITSGYICASKGLSKLTVAYWSYTAT